MIESYCNLSTEKKNVIGLHVLHVTTTELAQNTCFTAFYSECLHENTWELSACGEYYLALLSKLSMYKNFYMHKNKIL